MGDLCQSIRAGLQTDPPKTYQQLSQLSLNDLRMVQKAIPGVFLSKIDGRLSPYVFAYRSTLEVFEYVLSQTERGSISFELLSYSALLSGDSEKFNFAIRNSDTPYEYSLFTIRYKFFIIPIEIYCVLRAAVGFRFSSDMEELQHRKLNEVISTNYDIGLNRLTELDAGAMG